jgi:hypothetical protein
MLEFAGEIASEARVAFVTVTEAVPLIPAELAVMVAVPAIAAVASPKEFTDTIFCAEDDHVNGVSICVLPSSKLPVAVNCSAVPTAIVEVAGLTEMDCRWAATTVRVEESVKPPTVAVMLVVPALRVVATPVLSTLATAVVEELQTTPLLRSALVPSL